jgi:hypothetical protein
MKKIYERYGPELKEETIKAYDFVEKMVSRADGNINDHYPYWHGWALREAFEAGFNYCKKASNE